MKLSSAQSRFNTVVKGTSTGITVLAKMVKDVGMEFVFLLGWTSITWGIVGANLRYWAISIGSYLVFNALLSAWAARDK